MAPNFSLPTNLTLTLALCCIILSLAVTLARAEDPKPKPAKKDTMIAGKAEILRAMPKHFARLVAADAARRTVTLLIENESLAKLWTLTPDAEVKVHGWWGRLDQLEAGQRVWVWFNLDRDKHPINVLMIADELSEQDIHGSGLTVEAAKGVELTVKGFGSQSRKLKMALEDVERGKTKAPIDSIKVGEKLYVQSTGDQARRLLDAEAFESLRVAQRAALRQRWQKEGLPGSVMFRHLSGELEYMLDHEAMRWGRSLKPGDKVTLQTAKPIPAQVQSVSPWHERTKIHLVIAGADLADLSAGQRVALLMTPPSAEVDRSQLPPDLERPRSKTERIEWFLASIYCTCKVRGNGCTGQFYTLASCNPNACGVPNEMRGVLAGHIDKGLNDKQIFELLLKEHGPDLLRPHLVH